MTALDLEVLKQDIGEQGMEQPTEREAIAALLTARRFDPTKTPPPLRAIYTLTDQVIATPGNLATITAASKAGKSAVVGAMAAAVLSRDCGADLLGFDSSNPKNFALLWFDSEQSPDDHWHCVARALKRAGLREPPSWFYSYCLTGLGWKRGWDCVVEATRNAAEQHAGIHSSLLDGVADLVPDVNDPAQSSEFVAELHDMAIRYDCPIVGVIHFNPGSEKTRGHLGSHLERKAETNLRLDKANGMTTIWSEKQRRAPIPKEAGLCFQWSDEAGMHVSVDAQAAPGKSAKSKADLLAHVPPDGSIAQTVLLEKGNAAGMGQKKCRAFLDELLSDGTLHVWLVKRKGTNPEKRVSRQSQPTQQEMPA